MHQVLHHLLVEQRKNRNRLSSTNLPFYSVLIMLSKKLQSRLRRKTRIRKKVFGTTEMPRMVVRKSNKNIYIQFVDDSKGVTLLSVSTLSLKLKPSANVKAASMLGDAVGKRAVEVGIKKVVFDRGGYIYHGCVKAFADTARVAGLKF